MALRLRFKLLARKPQHYFDQFLKWAFVFFEMFITILNYVIFVRQQKKIYYTLKKKIKKLKDKTGQNIELL